MENKNLANNIPKQGTDPFNLRAPDFLPRKKEPRWSSLDIARGIAIFLMILSHCVKGLLHKSQIPDWGVVPVHLLTKFSSSLFILVFGMSVSLFFLKHVGQDSWKAKRFWMIKRGLELMLWYKVLTYVQMFQFYPESMIMDTLLFKRMPDFVEILSFYSIALLWLPFFLPLWSRMGQLTKIGCIGGTFAVGQYLHFNFDFGGYEVLKALLVEEEGFYTFGQLQRGALIFLGLYIGDLYKHQRDNQGNSTLIPWSCVVSGVLFLQYFYFSNAKEFGESLQKISDNVGKHPFNVNFFAFSVGGSLLILGLCLLANKMAQKYLRPVSYLGQHSLNAFILHIIIIFYFFRYYFDLHHNVTYWQSLQLTGLCTLSIMFVMYLWTNIKKAFK